MWLLLVALTGVALVGCTDENENGQQQQYGYLQFKVGQAVTRAAGKLESLADAKKVKVVLQSDGSAIEQTLLLNAYSNETAEYGLRSDKLRLLAGEYTLVGYALYDALDKEVQQKNVDEEPFTIVPGGLYVKHLGPDVVERGRVSFRLVKEWAKTRAAGEGGYPFGNIRVVDITVQNLFTTRALPMRPSIRERIPRLHMPCATPSLGSRPVTTAYTIVSPTPTRMARLCSVLNTMPHRRLSP